MFLNTFLTSLGHVDALFWCTPSTNLPNILSVKNTYLEIFVLHFLSTLKSDLRIAPPSNSETDEKSIFLCSFWRPKKFLGCIHWNKRVMWELYDLLDASHTFRTLCFEQRRRVTVARDPLRCFKNLLNKVRNFYKFGPKKYLKKMNIFRTRRKSSRKWRKMLWSHTSVFLHFSDSLVGSISSICPPILLINFQL